MKTKTVNVSKLTNRAMIAGGEKSITKVIDEGMLKEWVGIGWITARTATKTDRAKYPEVQR